MCNMPNSVTSKVDNIKECKIKKYFLFCQVVSVSVNNFTFVSIRIILFYTSKIDIKYIRILKIHFENYWFELQTIIYTIYVIM